MAARPIGWGMLRFLRRDAGRLPAADATSFRHAPEDHAAAARIELDADAAPADHWAFEQTAFCGRTPASPRRKRLSPEALDARRPLTVFLEIKPWQVALGAAVAL